MSMPAGTSGAAPSTYMSRVMAVEEQWIDYNGHMNMAYYNVLFDRCADGAFELLGLGPDYAEKRRLTTYSAEAHICYVRELHLRDEVTCSLHLLDHDEKRMRFYQELRHVEGWLAATSEVLALHIDMSGPRVAPWPADILANIEKMRTDHAALAWPERAGRGIAIRRRAS